MTWSYCQDAHEFLLKRRDVLLAEESRNCLAWAAIDRSKRQLTTPNAYRFLIFQKAATPTAHAFIHDADRHIILGAMTHSQARDLVTFLIQQAVPIGTIEGPWETAEEFSRRWSISTQSSADSQMDQGLYELTRVEMPASEGGSLVQVQEEHRSILHSFVTGFLSIFPNDTMTPRAVDQRVGRFIDEKRAYLWQQEDKTFVSMAAIVRETPHTSSISWVFTPPQYRRRGHAARVVANLSKAQLDAGKRACNLHTDLNNPTSNNVYRGIGFKMIARSFRIRIIQE